jgi:hypothetical protein
MHRALIAFIKGSIHRSYTNYPRAKVQRGEPIYWTCGSPEASQEPGELEKEMRDDSKANMGYGGPQEGMRKPMGIKSATSVNCSPVVSRERLLRAQATQDVYFVGIIETLIQKCSENSTKRPLSFLDRILREF